MFKSFNHIYNLIIQSTVIAFGIIFTILCSLLVYFFFNNVLWYIPFVFFAVIVSILVGAYLYVVLSVPFRLPAQFDEIKNKVALGELKGIQDFQNQVAEFIVGFFSFFGANIIGGKFHFSKCEPYIIDCEVDFSLLNKEAFKKNKLWLKSNKRAFYIPINLGSYNLGYMIIITEGYTLPVLYTILIDFENYYLDDQILHLVKE